jgi:hypothetical protein
MSHKSTVDAKREGYPFTARQSRPGNRMSRKQARIAVSRPKRQRKSAPKRK